MKPCNLVTYQRKGRNPPQQKCVSTQGRRAPPVRSKYLACNSVQPRNILKNLARLGGVLLSCTILLVLLDVCIFVRTYVCKFFSSFVCMYGKDRTGLMGIKDRCHGRVYPAMIVKWRASARGAQFYINDCWISYTRTYTRTLIDRLAA